MLRRAIFAPNMTPEDGLTSLPIHDLSVRASRRTTTIPCGPGGSCHDYVPFYFGPLSPMLLKLRSGRVATYTGRQDEIVYLCADAEEIASGQRFVFTDGHALAHLSEFFDSLDHLDSVDWTMVKEKYWSDNIGDNDRMRRKQAEFLAYLSVPWKSISAVGVISIQAQSRVKAIMDAVEGWQPPVVIRPGWYY